jgi:hypothetical protein
MVLGAVTYSADIGARQADYGGYRPHYQGFGVNTRGGRGGVIYTVTHLNDTVDTRSPMWQGSLRRAVTARGPRFVLFEVGGTIALVTPLTINNPHLTIAGQTAPSPGVTLRDRPVFLDTNDIVIQHLRVRLGDSACANDCRDGGFDALYVRNNAFNIVLDHLSLSWGTHGGISINAWAGPEPRDIAILDSIVAENLAKRLNPFGVGTLFMPADHGTATFARNLHAHNGNRNPWVSPGWRFAGYNNLAYNAGNVAGDGGTLGFFQLMGGYGYGGAADLVWQSNVAIAGPNTHVDGKAIKIYLRPDEVRAGHRLFMADNIGPYQTEADQWRGVTYQDAAAEWAVRATSPPAWYEESRYQVLPSSQVVAHVLANAGARPLDRDSVDARIVRDVVDRTGGRIREPADVGGYPGPAASRQSLAMPANPTAIVDGAGRTRIEAWLEGLARALEPRWQTDAPTPPLRFQAGVDLPCTVERDLDG